MTFLPNQNYNNNNSNNVLSPILKESIEIFVSCRDLIKKDVHSKSDPFIILYVKDSKNKSFVEIGRTEVIYDNHNPNFSKQFRMDYFFEEEQILRFDCYDEDKKGSKRLKDHDILGSCSMALGELVHSSGSRMAKKLMLKGKNLKNKKTKRFSHVIATLEQINEQGNTLITMQLSANGLPKMDGFFGKSDPYFLICRTREDGKEVTVYGDRENFIKRTLDPVWKPFKIESQRLCNNDEYRPIRIKVYDWDSNGSDDFIGQIDTNLNELKNKPRKMHLKRSQKKNKTYGTLNVLSYEAQSMSSFLDYMNGDLDMSLMVVCNICVYACVYIIWLCVYLFYFES